VPILGEKLEGEIVAVYNESVRAGNPLTSFRLVNSSELTLEGGPATVFRDGEYSGEAMLDTMRPGEERLVPFSVELGCRITRAFDSGQAEEQRITLERGALMHTTWTVRKTTYTIRNTTRRALKLFLDHPPLGGAEYLDSPAPEERTESYDRFVLEIEPDSQRAFALVERQRHYQRLWLRPESVESQIELVHAICGKGELDAALDPLLALAREIAALEEERTRIDQRVQKIREQHERIRQNLGSLGTVSKRERELRERYVETLDRDETTLDELETRRAGIEEKLAETRSRFENGASDLSS
jgi:hypothetical protein